MTADFLGTFFNSNMVSNPEISISSISGLEIVGQLHLIVKVTINGTPKNRNYEFNNQQDLMYSYSKLKYLIERISDLKSAKNRQKSHDHY